MTSERTGADGPRASPAPTLSSMRTHATADSSRHRILVVEDDDTIGRHLETGLRGNGYAPTWSRTGSAALTLAARTP